MEERKDIGFFDWLGHCEYKQSKCKFSLMEVLIIYHDYFKYYQAFMGKDHPPIKRQQIRRIINAMEYVEDTYGTVIELYPFTYPALIEQYFCTDFKNCDRNINHFFSGQIRAVKYYESCY